MDDTTGIAGFSADTEILTRTQGWITFERLTCLDEVATRSSGGRFEWRHPERVRFCDYDGGVVHFHGRSLDVLVGPGNVMLHKADARGPERYALACQLAQKAMHRSREEAGATLVATSAWAGAEMASRIFPGVRRNKKGPAPRDFAITGDQYAAFMGAYIAEGSVATGRHFHKVSIAQTQGGKGYEEYRALLKEICGREPGRGGHQWQIYSRPLYEYLHPLGTARDKRLPPEVLELSRRQLEIFWHFYFLGDGSYEEHLTSRAQAVATASFAFAGQLQEIAQKIGSSASVRTYALRPNARVRATGAIHKLRLRATANPACAVRLVRYTGIIVTLSLPDGVVYVRRDGKPAWAGV